MPFDTVERSSKRIRAELSNATDDDDWYMHETASTFEIYNHPKHSNNNETSNSNSNTLSDWNKSSSYTTHQQSYYPYQSSVLSSPPMDSYMLPATPATIPIDIPYSTSHNNDYTTIDSSSISPQSNHYWQDDQLVENTSSAQQQYLSSFATSPTPTTPTTATTTNNGSPRLLVDTLNNSSQQQHYTITTPTSFLQHPPAVAALPSPTTQEMTNPLITDVLSKIKFSYSDVGINLEAKISNASDLRSLIDAFSQMCCSPSSAAAVASSFSAATAAAAFNNTIHVASQQQSDKMLLYKNKSNNTKPVNFFASTSRLGQISNPHSTLNSINGLRQIADACIDTYFTCWVRYKPILRQDEFRAWYEAQQRPTDTLIVNAICSYVFRHMVIHHPRPGLNHFLKDQDKLQEQEEYFFAQARECLSQSFDTPDRYTVAALLMMSTRADEPSKRHHYAGMAVRALHELEIYPRMMDDENVDSFEKEMDTRLWWFAWAIDFSLWTAGAPKNTPQPRFPGGQVDLPQVFEQDIDEVEIGVIAYMYCLSLWKIQGDIVAALYENDQENHAELTVEQLAQYDRQLLDFHQALPSYLKFDSGFEYGREDLFLACLRVQIEYNATRIILHKLFIPEMNDTRPSQASLESLNICLSTALTQLSAIKTCNMADVGRCAFDRDELWRAAEVISVAMDIYDTCVSPADQAKILKGIKMQDFTKGLMKSYEVLKNTREFRFSCKNWFQVADWIQVEIRRHQLSSSYHYIQPVVKEEEEEEAVKKNQPDYFSAHLKPNAILNPETQQLKKLISTNTTPTTTSTASITSMSPPKSIHNTKSSSSSRKSSISSSSSRNNNSTRKSISFQNQFSVQTPPPSSTSTFSTIHMNNQQQEERRPSFSTAPPFVQFNAYVPPDQQQPTTPGGTSGGKSQARFRYFNPRKMNKFLFIDEHPMM